MIGEPQAQRYRAESGAFERQIYFNNARISPYARSTHECFLAAATQHFEGDWSPERDRAVMADTRMAVAGLLNAEPEEIAITQSATHSVNQLINGMRWEAGDNIVWSDLEYRSIAHTLLNVRDRFGVALRKAKSHDFLHAADDLLKLVDGRTKLVILPMVPTYCGVVQPVGEIGAALETSDVSFAVNATQAIGQIGVDVKAIRCDFLFGTSRKYLRGPRGLGMSFIRGSRLQDLSVPVLGFPSSYWDCEDRLKVASGIERFQAGDYPYPSLVALAQAARNATEIGLENIAERNAVLGGRLRSSLSKVPGVQLYDAAHGTTGTVPFNVGGHSADEVVARLLERNIRTCTLDTQVARSAFESIDTASLVRASVHYLNLESEIELFTSHLYEIFRS